MNQKSLLTLILLLLALSACLPTGSEPTPIAIVPTSTVPTPETTATPPTNEANPTITPTSPTSTATAIPGVPDPVLTTQTNTNVRLGPGTIYGVAHILPAGTTTPIVGKNLDSTWWFVSNRGLGEDGWVSAAVVTTRGDTGDVPFMAAPTLTPTPAASVMGNSGPPPVSTCVVAHPGPGDTGPLYVYEGPDEHAFALVVELGLNRWVTVIGRDNAWYHIQDATGMTGWVPVAQVAHNGLCQPDDGPGSIPLIKDPGSPPADRCIAHRSGQFPPPDIHLGPGRQFALIARLGNWAEVLKTEAGWHQILLGPGEVGWINDDDVDLTGPCATAAPAPERIQFAPGETSITLEGMLEPPQRDFYLFRAFAGQRTTIEIVSEFNRANFGRLVNVMPVTATARFTQVMLSRVQSLTRTLNPRPDWRSSW